MTLIGNKQKHITMKTIRLFIKMNRLLKTMATLMITTTLFILSGCEKENLFYKHEYVDLGLPSGNLWATCNVGADSPEEYGDYFAWGETEPKRVYNLDTYKYRDSIPYLGHGEDVLRGNDDAASVKWGGNWHIPTYSDWWELCHETTIEKTSKNGVKGLCFKGSNGNSLFLPYTGCIAENELYEVGVRGEYWTSTCVYVDFHQWFQLILDNFDIEMQSEGYVYHGRSIRPVRSAE